MAFFFSYNVNAASGAPCGHYLSEDGLTEGQCETAEVDPYDLSSLQRGAQIYMNYCFGIPLNEFNIHNVILKDKTINKFAISETFAIKPKEPCNATKVQRPPI